MNKITYEERAKVYTAAADTFGATTQLIVALEELSEVQKEICKALRGKCDLGHLAEEVADATIMLEQVRQLFRINDLTCQYMDVKVTRLQDDIDKAKAKNQSLASIFADFLGGQKDKKAVVE
jgi:hypothetical protein